MRLFANYFIHFDILYIIIQIIDRNFGDLEIFLAFWVCMFNTETQNMRNPSILFLKFRIPLILRFLRRIDDW